MRKILVTVVIVLFAANVNAQTGMPKELSCTETAFNFSFSLGNNWKFITPKMGPVEVTNNEPGNIPIWLLKASNVTPEKQLPEVVNTGNLAHQNYNHVSSINSFKALDVTKYLLPDVNFNFPMNYTMLKPVPITL